MPFFLNLSLMAIFFWSCRYGGFEGIPASHILLSQRPDSKEKQVINLDQDVQVYGYFWWMVYELLCMHHLTFSFFLDKGLSSFFFLTCLSMWHTFFGYASFILFILNAEACGIPSLGMHFFFCIAPYPWHIFEREWCHT